MPDLHLAYYPLGQISSTPRKDRPIACLLAVTPPISTLNIQTQLHLSLSPTETAIRSTQTACTLNKAVQALNFRQQKPRPELTRWRVGGATSGFAWPSCCWRPCCWPSPSRHPLPRQRCTVSLHECQVVVRHYCSSCCHCSLKSRFSSTLRTPSIQDCEYQANQPVTVRLQYVPRPGRYIANANLAGYAGSAGSLLLTTAAAPHAHGRVCHACQ